MADNYVLFAQLEIEPWERICSGTLDECIVKASEYIEKGYCVSVRKENE